MEYDFWTDVTSLQNIKDLLTQSTNDHQPVFIFAILACTHWYVLFFSLSLCSPPLNSFRRPFQAPPEYQRFTPAEPRSINSYKNAVIAADHLFANLTDFMTHKNFWNNIVMVCMSATRLINYKFNFVISGLYFWSRGVCTWSNWWGGNWTKGRWYVYPLSSLSIINHNLVKRN